MEKSYIVFICNKSILDNPEGNKDLIEAYNYSSFWFKTLTAARKKANEFARSGTVSIIYESIEFRQIQPVPIVVEIIAIDDPDS